MSSPNPVEVNRKNKRKSRPEKINNADSTSVKIAAETKHKKTKQSNVVVVPTIQKSFTITKPPVPKKNVRKIKKAIHIIAETFERASVNKDLQGIWICDLRMIELLSDKYRLKSMLPKNDLKEARKVLNTALSRSPKFQSIDQSVPWNESGCFRTVQMVGPNRRACFYYFSGCESIGPSVLKIEDAKLLYAESEKQQLLDGQQQPTVDEQQQPPVDEQQQPTAVNDSPDAVVAQDECVPDTKEPTMESDENVAAAIEEKNQSDAFIASLNFWNSSNAKKLFGSDLEDELDVKESLRHKVAICERKAEESRASKVSYNYLTLRLAYNVALNNMPEVSWSECCERALDHMQIAGIATVKDPKSIGKWNQFFRTHLYLESDPHHIVPKEPSELKLFASFPKAKEMANLYMATTTETVSIESFRLHMVDVIIPTIVHEENAKLVEQGEEPKWTYDSLLASIGLKLFSKHSSFRHLTKLGYKYCYDKKRFAINCTRPKAKYKCKPAQRKAAETTETTENENDSETSYY